MRSYTRGSDLLPVIRDRLAEELGSEGALAVYELREWVRLGTSFPGIWTHMAPGVRGSSVLPESCEGQ